MNQKTKFKQTELGMIPEEYPTKKIGVGATVFSGFAFKSDDLNDKQGIPVVKIGNIHDRKVTLNGSQFFPEELVNEKLDKFFLEDRDVLIAMTGQGSVGRVGQIRLNEEKVLLNQRVGKFVVDNKNLDRDYLYFVVSSPRYEQILFDTGSGSGQPNLSPTQILSVEIPLPRIEIQIKISEVLRSLNDKISLNHSMNKTLEAIGQALFKRWFIDFEFPNDEGKPYKSSGGKMVHNELGKIPKGWRVGTISEIYKTTSGGTPSRTKEEFYKNGTIKWVKSKELNGSFIFETEEKITEDAVKNSSAKKIPKHSLLIAMYGATVGEYGILSSDATCNQAICAVIPNDSYPYSYIFGHIKINKHNIKNQASGSAQQNISQALIQRQKILIPSSKVVITFHEIVEALFEKMETNLFVNHTIIKIRDSLLPKLMSGKIRVPVEVKL